MISLGKGQCGENSHHVNSLKVIHISSLEEWIPFGLLQKREELELMRFVLTLQNSYSDQDS